MLTYCPLASVTPAEAALAACLNGHPELAYSILQDIGEPSLQEIRKAAQTLAALIPMSKPEVLSFSSPPFEIEYAPLKNVEPDCRYAMIVRTDSTEYPFDSAGRIFEIAKDREIIYKDDGSAYFKLRRGNICRTLGCPRLNGGVWKILSEDFIPNLSHNMCYD